MKEGRAYRMTAEEIWKQRKNQATLVVNETIGEATAVERRQTYFRENGTAFGLLLNYLL